MRTILFICTGNTCRSPVAEAIAHHWLDRGVLGDQERYLVASAGTATTTGARPTTEAIRSVADLEIELDGRSKPLTADMIRNAEAVFGMTAGHVEAARTLVGDDPETTDRIHPLDPDEDIADPIGMGQEAYDRLVERFMVLIPNRLKEVFSREDRAGIGSPGS